MNQDSIVVDCDTCVGRGSACAECVFAELLGGPPDWTVDERRALEVLTRAGLIASADWARRAAAS